uniref:Putative secreted peptide n=1 Tax=Anopheles braziliensis TaxID=58242 RepID=A0A2M3ZRR9_9DIPT
MHVAIIIVSTLIIVLRGIVAIGGTLFVGARFWLGLEIFLCYLCLTLDGMLFVTGQVYYCSACIANGRLSFCFCFVLLLAEE